MATSDQGLAPETFRRLAEYVALPLSDARLEELRPQVEAYLRNVGRLRTLDLRGVEPALVLAPPQE